MENSKLSPNVILADADYIDKVAFDLSVNFERMLGRRIPPADMARWIDCVALDGGIREGDNEVQVILVHERTTSVLENFSPSSLDDDLNGKAFKDHLGEFCISSITVEDGMVDKEHLFCDSLMHVCSQPEVKRVMVIPNGERWGASRTKGCRRREAHHRICYATYAWRQFPTGNSGLFAHERIGHQGGRGESLRELGSLRELKN